MYHTKSTTIEQVGAGSSTLFLNDPIDPTKFPPILAWTILISCIVPSIFILLGINLLSVPQSDSALAATLQNHDTLAETFAYNMSGAFTHTILEWTAFTKP